MNRGKTRHPLCGLNDPGADGPGRATVASTFPQTSTTIGSIQHLSPEAAEILTGDEGFSTGHHL